MISVNGNEIIQKHFPDNTLHLTNLPMDGMHINWVYENDAELFTLICLVRHYQERGEHNLTLTMEYVPHARMDRTEDNNTAFTLKYFCEVINSLNFRQINVLDVHSSVALALLNNVKKLPVEMDIKAAINTHGTSNIALFFPDEGAFKRYSNMSVLKDLNLPMAYGNKKRDWATGKIIDLLLVNEKAIIGKDVLIIDDICSKGGTFMRAAKALKDAGAKSVSMYVSHCEPTILKGEILDSNLIERVYTTPSLIHPDELTDHYKMYYL